MGKCAWAVHDSKFNLRPKCLQIRAAARHRIPRPSCLKSDSLPPARTNVQTFHVLHTAWGALLTYPSGRTGTLMRTLLEMKLAQLQVSIPQEPPELRTEAKRQPRSSRTINPSHPALGGCHEQRPLQSQRHAPTDWEPLARIRGVVFRQKLRHRNTDSKIGPGGRESCRKLKENGQQPR